jgi:cellulose biosynthesis protein BcsQ
MKSIGFFNNKGGVGKTTLICNLASSLAVNKKLKVLIVDADPQCNASAYLLPEEELEKILLDNKHNSLDSFYEPIRRGQGYPIEMPTIVRSERFKVDLIVGDPKLSIREDLLATDWASTRNGESRGFQTTYAIKELLSRLNNYDLVLVDMGPSLGALNRSVLLAVDYFLMPLSVDIFSLMAVGNIISSFDNWRQSLEDAIAKHHRDEGYNKAKTKGGIRQPVQAFERIIEKQKDEIANLCSAFNVNQSDVDLGVIPTLSSVVPLSQQAHAPVFSLGAQDGIVGSQYTRVSEAGEYFHSISEVLYARLFE